MIKDYLKKVCNLEEEVHKRSLRLNKATYEYEEAQKRIGKEKERLKNELNNKRTKISELIVQRKELSEYVPKGLSSIILVFLAIIVGTLLFAWGIRVLVLNVFCATDAISATAAYSVINIPPIFFAWYIVGITDMFTRKNTVIFIGGYAAITALTLLYFFVFENKGYSISYAMTFFMLVLRAIEVIVGVAVYFYEKNERDKEYMENCKKLRQVEKKINNLKLDEELADKELSEYIAHSQKALNLMDSDIIAQKQGLDNAKEDLSKLYAKNILYPKYQNWVAAATIYEYLDSEICSQLKYYEGAYRFYEEQLIRKQILSSLTALKESVEVYGNKIAYSQKYIRNQLEECNRNLESYKFNTYGY